MVFGDVSRIVAVGQRNTLTQGRKRSKGQLLAILLGMAMAVSITAASPAVGQANPDQSGQPNPSNQTTPTNPTTETLLLMRTQPEKSAQQADEPTVAELEEATRFFDRLAQEARNPYIVILAKQSRERLQKRTQTAMESGFPAQGNAPALNTATSNIQFSTESARLPEPTTSRTTPQDSVVTVFTSADGAYAVPAIARQGTQKAMGTFIVDTGSSYTVLTPRMAKRLNITPTKNTPHITIMTANGAIRAPKLKLASLTIGDVTVTDVDVVIQDLGNDLLLCGLLGMNFFQDKEVTLSQNHLKIRESAVSTQPRRRHNITLAQP